MTQRTPNLRIVFLAFVLITILVLVIGIAGGIVLDRRILAQGDPEKALLGVAAAQALPAIQAQSTSSVSDDINLISEAMKLIENNYVERTNLKTNQLVYGAISGMMDALGDTGHSRFLTPDMVRAERTVTNGSFEGIGAEVQSKNGNVVIVAPIDGSPAQKAGVRPGDIIVKVDGEDVTGQSLASVIQRILGPAGTKVTITLQDPQTGETRDLTITRARIQLHNVTWQMLPGTTIAHLRIAEFSNGVTNDLIKALKEIRAQKATGIVLDLRNNPGGLLGEAVGVTSQFLKDGTVLQEKNAQDEVKITKVKPGGLATDIPMVVLINGGTASASEIVSGALQDAKRATLVGEKTFGTGTVLNEFSLSDKSALLLATEEWLTPNGRVIWHEGISPDVTAVLPNTSLPLTPESEQGLTPSQLNNSQDSQLLKGIETLQKLINQANLETPAGAHAYTEYAFKPS
jgi:carboxyl-terminal processing protease